MKILSMLFLTVFSSLLYGQEQLPAAKQLISFTKADTWVAIDGIGRELIPSNKGIRKDKYVGMFYFIWQGAHGYDTNHKKSDDEGVQEKLPTDTRSPYDITKLLKENPANPQYGPNHAFHHWGEPYFGYYLSDDEWIIRKHAQMLSDAGVDVIILDVTNAAIYLPQVTKIAETYRKLRKEGISTPDIAFIANSQPKETVSRLYESIYKPGLFKDLWFYWKGKPLLLCPPEGLTDEIKTYFSHRHSWAWSTGEKWFADGKDKWPWIDHSPQSYGWHEAKDKPEQMAVAIAEHPIGNVGRSHVNGKQPENPESGLGLHFQEQWNRALKVDPEFIFVTGWNEWVAMRFIDGRAKKMMGKSIEKGETFFVDLYNAEFSRDAEPVKGDFNDNYYYQLIDNIRKYKGARSIPVFTEEKTITVDGKFKDWENVKATFNDDKGDTYHRKHAGWGRIGEYVNTSGRNDLILSKITSDENNVYFYVKTADNLSSSIDENWMNLLLKTTDLLPNWEGFNYVISKKSNVADYTLSKFKADGSLETLEKVELSFNKNEIEIAISKKDLNIKNNQFIIDFKWTDNIAKANAMLWLDQGDTAPNARFRYRYIKQ